MKVTQKWYEEYLERRSGEAAKKQPSSRGVCNPEDQIHSTKPERPVRDEPLGKGQGKKDGYKRFLVSVVARRSKLIDPDNICSKHIIDCARRSGLIEDDTPECIEFGVRQEKVNKGEEETVITVTRIQ
jgi:hypothetical protein